MELPTCRLCPVCGMCVVHYRECIDENDRPTGRLHTTTEATNGVENAEPK